MWNYTTTALFCIDILKKFVQLAQTFFIIVKNLCINCIFFDITYISLIALWVSGQIFSGQSSFKGRVTKAREA